MGIPKNKNADDESDNKPDVPRDDEYIPDDVVNGVFVAPEQLTFAAKDRETTPTVLITRWTTKMAQQDMERSIS